MMDYEHQPANHLSFQTRANGDRARGLRRARAAARGRPLGEGRPLPRLQGTALPRLPRGRRRGARRPRPRCGPAAGGDAPGAGGALYHRMENDRFDRLLADFLERPASRRSCSARRADQRERYRRRFPGAVVPERAVDAASLLALADATVGAGGTMTRESAVLGTPTYTVFAGRLAGVDAELDPPRPAARPACVRRPPRGWPSRPRDSRSPRRRRSCDTVVAAVYAAAK